MHCEVWPASSGRCFIHVPMGVSHQGWRSFLEMLKSFAKKSKSFVHQIYTSLGSISAQINKDASASCNPNVFNVSYAAMVRKRGGS